MQVRGEGDPIIGTDQYQSQASPDTISTLTQPQSRGGVGSGLGILPIIDGRDARATSLMQAA